MSDKKKPRVVRRGQRAILNGKRVIPDGKGNWMPASHYDRQHKDFRKGKPVGKYVVGQDRNKAETAAQRERRIFPETEAQARRRIGTGKKSKDRLRMERAIKQGGGRTGEAYVGTGQPTTKPKSAGTKPAQTKKPKSKPKKDNRPTTVKEIAGAEAFIAKYENKKGAMQNAVRQAKERLRRLKAKRAEEVRGNRPRNA